MPALVLLGLLLVALAGCGGNDRARATRTVTHTETTPGLKGGKAIEVEIIKAKGNETAVLVPVYIRGKGPFPFLVDTGATQSLISPKLVRRLHIRVVGRSDDVTGIGGKATAKSIAVDDWRAGRVVLPRQKIVTLDTKGVAGRGGLLGSDVLSEFGKVLVDYKREKLVFGPRP